MIATCFWHEQAIREWSRHVISIVACCQSVKQWWSLETWSRFQDSSWDPFLRVSNSVLVSKVPDLVSVSVSTATGLETLTIKKKWL